MSMVEAIWDEAATVPSKAHQCVLCARTFALRGGLLAHSRVKHLADLVEIAEACAGAGRLAEVRA